MIPAGWAGVDPPARRGGCGGVHFARHRPDLVHEDGNGGGEARPDRTPADKPRPGFPHFRTSFRTAHRPETRMDPSFPHFRTFRTCKPGCGAAASCGDAGRPPIRGEGGANPRHPRAGHRPTSHVFGCGSFGGGGGRKSGALWGKTGPPSSFAKPPNRQGGASLSLPVTALHCLPVRPFGLPTMDRAPASPARACRRTAGGAALAACCWRRCATRPASCATRRPASRRTRATAAQTCRR